MWAYDNTAEGLGSITYFPVHNIFPHVTAETGVLGAAAFMWLVAILIIDATGYACKQNDPYRKHAVIGMLGVHRIPGAWTGGHRVHRQQALLLRLVLCRSHLCDPANAGLAKIPKYAPPGSRAGAMNTLRTLAKNSAASLVIQMTTPLASFVIVFVIARTIGNIALGQISAALSTYYIFEAVAAFGLNALIVRDVSQARERGGAYLVNASILTGAGRRGDHSDQCGTPRHSAAMTTGWWRASGC